LERNQVTLVSVGWNGMLAASWAFCSERRVLTRSGLVLVLVLVDATTDGH
jgi:hypothetical protein